MNLLECHIVEIYSEETYPRPEWDTRNRDWVYVKFRMNCHGRESNITDIFVKEDWEDIKKKGYYLS